MLLPKSQSIGPAGATGGLMHLSNISHQASHHMIINAFKADKPIFPGWKLRVNYNIESFYWPTTFTLTFTIPFFLYCYQVLLLFSWEREREREREPVSLIILFHVLSFIRITYPTLPNVSLQVRYYNFICKLFDCYFCQYILQLLVYKTRSCTSSRRIKYV